MSEKNNNKRHIFREILASKTYIQKGGYPTLFRGLHGFRANRPGLVSPLRGDRAARRKCLVSRRQSQWRLGGQLGRSDPKVSLGSVSCAGGQLGEIHPPDGVSGAALKWSQEARDRCPQCRGAGGCETRRERTGH